MKLDPSEGIIKIDKGLSDRIHRWDRAAKSDAAKGSVKDGMLSGRKRNFVSDQPIDSFASLRNADQYKT